MTIMVSADAVPRCKPPLIFKGTDGKKKSRITKEMKQYDPGFAIQWNLTAYCNETVMVRWLKHQYKYVTVGFTNSTVPRLPSLDVFTG